MSNRRTYRKIAKANGVTTKEVKSDMQLALNCAYENTPDNGVTEAYQNRVPRKNEVPTADEFIKYAAQKVRSEQKK